MPEIPDVTVYVEALRERLIGHILWRVSIRSPFLLRSTSPAVESVHGKTVREIRRVGKRIAIGFDNGVWMALHLMIAGRLHWRPSAPKPGPKGPLAVFEFDSGALVLTEAGSQHRASLQMAAGEADLRSLDAGGIEVLESSLASFARALQSANHTLKRALTDPRLFSGIGNAYSDEILHAAQLSPIKLTQAMSDEEIARLFDATRAVLRDWTARLQQEEGGRFPEKVTAFRPGMAVHGRYGQPCPRCGAPVQRIVYARNESNYCASCQTGGRLLADRALSRLLRDDWPKTLEDLERAKRR